MNTEQSNAKQAKARATRAANAAAGYTHLVTTLTFDEFFNVMLPKSFRTTADAVDLHRAACERRKAAGEIESYSIRPL